jgi:hypothetical protein
MVDNPTIEPKFRPFFTHIIHITASVFHIISLVDCLVV